MSTNTDQAALEAVLDGRVDEVRELLRADPSLVEPARGRPPLLLEAATDGRSEIVSVLLEAGARPDWGDSLSPLTAAAANGHVEVVKVLIEAGSDVAEDQGLYALQTAIRRHQLDVVRVLVDSGAPITVPGREEDSALESARLSCSDPLTEDDENRAEAIANYLEERSPADQYQLWLNWRKLRESVAAGDCEAAAQILERGVVVSRSGNPFVKTAVQRDDLEMVDLLRKHGGDFAGLPYEALAHSRLEIVQAALAEAGELEPEYLAEAAHGGRPEVVQWLLDQGLDPTRRVDGDTAIEAAAREGRHEVMDLLAPLVPASQRSKALKILKQDRDAPS